MNSKQRRAANMPSRRVIDRMCERAEMTGCDRCGARFAEMLPYMVCRIRGGGFSVRCPDCSKIEATPLLVGAHYAPGGDPWSCDDRDWFAARPARRWRLREPWPGETASLAPGDPVTAAFRADAERQGLRLAIATFQVAAGKRQRTIVAVSTTDPLDSFTDAGITLLIPGLVERMNGFAPADDAEWQRMATRKMEDRLRVTASFGARGDTP